MDTKELSVLICGFLFIEVTFAFLFNVGNQAEFSNFFSHFDKVGIGDRIDKLRK